MIRLIQFLRDRIWLVALAGFVVAVPTAPSTSARGEEVSVTVKSIELDQELIVVENPSTHEEAVILVDDDIPIERDGEQVSLKSLRRGMHISVENAMTVARVTIDTSEGIQESILGEFLDNVQHNLFKPLLLFFYMGFLVPILRVKFEFPYVIYQALTIYLLIAIGWHGGEELAKLSPSTLGQAVGFMGVGFLTNLVIGLLAYLLLSTTTTMRRVDKATVAGYYGSDSAGTFVTCLGVLVSAHITYNAYMPVMLAVMEIPGCLVALYLVSRLRQRGMDPAGTMPDEPGYDPHARPALASGLGNGDHGEPAKEPETREPQTVKGEHRAGDDQGASPELLEAIEQERELSLEKRNQPTKYGQAPTSVLSPKMLHEVFLNPGLYLLFGSIVIGFISGLQGPEATRADDRFFVTLFHGVLCLFLLEMGMTASRKLRDLRSVGLGFILFGVLAPNLFATVGIGIAHTYSHLTGVVLEPGSYVLFSVLCASASYIAVPAVQRLAIPEASPTLPLAASLGLTFTYNVTIGIPVYIQISLLVTRAFPLC